MKLLNYSKLNLKKIRLSCYFIVFFVFCNSFLSHAIVPDTPYLSPLRARGFSLLPAPQEVELGPRNIFIDNTWAIELKVEKEDIAVQRLFQGASELHNLMFDATGNGKIILSVVPGIVKGTNDSALNEQGYVLRINPGKIEITGNSRTGLFYGVQSLLQLLRHNSAGKLILPECVIRDWPSLQIRCVHWDTKHHQKRLETMKRLIDWHAFFKVNMIAFEIEDKYEYPRHPVIGAPGAYTRFEMQELTRYALERHIQLVPDVQAPAHMAYVLKHEEFAHLKSDPASNYQACLCNPETMDLIFDMYQDMIDATPGVDYFLVSTDEIYYAGICDKCNRPYNPENRSLAWAEFAVKAHDWLAKHDRRMISWIEYPLLAKDIARLPQDIIDGVMGNDKDFIRMEKKVGIRQLAYSSIQGSEWLFPNYFPDRLTNLPNTISEGIAAGANPIGSIAAAWDDSGLHEEVFHLGWAAVTQYAWNINGPVIQQTIADFMDAFYGQNCPDMKSVYDLLIEGARFYENGWDRIPSAERKRGYGNSNGKGIGGRRSDELLSLPDIPEEGTLNLTTKFNDKYGELIQSAEKMKKNNDELIYKLTSYIGQVERNRYNLEVYLSISYLQRYFINTILTLSDAESLMLKARNEANENKPENAVAYLVEASNNVKSNMDWGQWMWRNLTKTWEKSRYEKGRSVNGRDYVYIMDDVKDHWADRRKGLDYLIAPFERMDIEKWQRLLNERIKKYASNHNIPVSGLQEKRLED